MNTEKDNEKEAAADAVVEKFQNEMEDLMKIKILHTIESEKARTALVGCSYGVVFIISFVTSVFFFGKESFPIFVFSAALSLFMFLKTLMELWLFTKEMKDYLDLMNKHKE